MNCRTFSQHPHTRRKSHTTLTMHNNTSFGAYFYSAGIQHGKLRQSFGTMSTVTYFILRVHTGTCVSYSWTLEDKNIKPQDIFGREKSLKKKKKKKVDRWIRKVDFGKEEIPGSKRSMRGYILTNYRLHRENLWALASQQMGSLISASAVPQCGT